MPTGLDCEGAGLDPGGLTPGCFLCHYYYAASQVEGVKQLQGLLSLRLLGGADFVISLFPTARYTNTSRRVIGTTLGCKDPISNHKR